MAGRGRVHRRRRPRDVPADDGRQRLAAESAHRRAVAEVAEGRAPVDVHEPALCHARCKGRRQRQPSVSAQHQRRVPLRPERDESCGEPPGVVDDRVPVADDVVPAWRVHVPAGEHHARLDRATSKQVRVQPRLPKRFRCLRGAWDRARFRGIQTEIRGRGEDRDHRLSLSRHDPSPRRIARRTPDRAASSGPALSAISPAGARRAPSARRLGSGWGRTTAESGRRPRSARAPRHRRRSPTSRRTR